MLEGFDLCFVTNLDSGVDVPEVINRHSNQAFEISTHFRCIYLSDSHTYVDDYDCHFCIGNVQNLYGAHLY
jgi:hypothetical protein